MNSKLGPPKLPAVCIERLALRASIDAGSSRKLTLVLAPVGSGKTVLLSQWQRAARLSRSVAWLSLDPQDNQAARFFAYLAGAISKAVGDFDTHTGAAILQADLPADLLALRLLEWLSGLEQAVSVVIDDFQHLHDPAMARAFYFLVHRSPPRIRWIVCGRSLPELACSELKLRDEVCIINGKALSFDWAEILALSREMRTLPLSPEQADHIRVRTDGWVTGVKLTLMSRTSDNEGSESAYCPAGLDLEILRYLDANVLRQQTPQLRQLLLCSSILERINGELCNALLDIGDGALLLETIERSQLFLQPIDGQPGWYRYHPLFHEFLRACLQRFHPERIAGLHRAASHWYAAQHLYEEALRHAFNSREQSWCVELVGRCAKLWLRDGEITSLVHWTRRLSREEILHNDVLATSYIASLILCRRFAQASAWLTDIERVMPNGGERMAALRARAQMLRLMLAVLSDGAVEIDLDVPMPLTEHCDSYLSGTLMTLQAYGLLRRCRFEQARRLALRVRNTMLEHDNRYAVGHADMLICLADFAQGDMQSATQICERMFDEVRHDPHSPAWANAAMAMARLRYEQNQLLEAEALCMQALPMLSTASTPEIFTVAHILLARLHAIAGRRAESFRLLDTLHSVLEGTGDRSWLGHVCYEKVSLQLSNSERERAAATAADFGLPQQVARDEWSRPRDYEACWERFGLVRAVLLLDAECFESCRTVLNVLATSAYGAGFVYRAAALEALLAVCNWRAGDQAAAYAALNRGLALMPEFGFSRGVFDEAPGLQEVIGAALRNAQLQYPLPADYLDRFADVFGTQSPQQRSSQPRSKLPMVEPLTEREAEVLRLLAEGLSNQQIGVYLLISVSTVKWHLRNLFSKLNVPTRIGALARARELKIIV